jgi:hypothetical protein
MKGCLHADVSMTKSEAEKKAREIANNILMPFVVEDSPPVDCAAELITQALEEASRDSAARSVVPKEVLLALKKIVLIGECSGLLTDSDPDFYNAQNMYDTAKEALALLDSSKQADEGDE